MVRTHKTEVYKPPSSKYAKVITLLCVYKIQQKFPIFFNLLFSSMNNKSRYVGIQCIQLWQYASIDASIIILRFVYLYDTHREHSFTNHYLFNACIQRRTHKCSQIESIVVTFCYNGYAWIHFKYWIIFLPLSCYFLLDHFLHC